MRQIVIGLAALLAAFVLAFAFHVSLLQAYEAGSFVHRVAKVLDRQFDSGAYFRTIAFDCDPEGAARQSAGLEAAQRERQLGPTPPKLPENADTSQIIQTTADVVAFRMRQENEVQLRRLEAKLRADADSRERSSFWLEVQINTLFLLLGLGAPVIARLLGRR